MIVEVEANPNCETGFFGRFKELGLARPVVHIRLYDRQSAGEWCAVTGWSDDTAQPCCPAVARPVEDSGAGITYLVSGGIFGLRFRPLNLEEAWSIESPNQWGRAVCGCGRYQGPPLRRPIEERDLKWMPVCEVDP